MRQFWEIKEKNSDAIILFRMGDFYETFEEDAIITSKILGITLTKRANGSAASVPLAGFPYHSLEQHLHKLLREGKRVAIAEQVEDPKLSRGIVKREVVEIITPGTSTSEYFLNQKENNFLMCIFQFGDSFGFGLLDHSTGEFKAGERDLKNLSTIIEQFSPAEILISKSQLDIIKSKISKNILITHCHEWLFDKRSCYNKIKEHFLLHNLKGFGLEKMYLATSACGVILDYLKKNCKSRLNHISSISVIKQKGFMNLNGFTMRNLEIFKPLNENDKKNTLVYCLDKTCTSPGGRLLKSWIINPLTNKKEIKNRHDIIEEIISQSIILTELQNYFKQISDVPRLLSKLNLHRATPRDVLQIGKSIQVWNNVKKKVFEFKLKKIKKLYNKYNDINCISKTILNSLEDDLPLKISQGNIFKKGISNDLDEIRSIKDSANDWLVNYQNEERNKNNINNLKIKYNKVFGYFIEITNSNLNQVPDNYIRKQTLTNSERYFTVELKEFEEKILNANEKIQNIENSLFNDLSDSIIKKSEEIQHNAKINAELDVLVGLASVAQMKKYCKPEIIDSNTIEIKNGRHPVIEQIIKSDEQFIPNDIYLNPKDKQIALITGPNMAGKSTFLRQIALIVLMTQIGSYVPAEIAKIGIVDQIFTRVGANDNLAKGESTFLVEMNETANIINNATKDSLIILDEIGRGTSTYDGLSIAWALTEHLHNNKNIAAKTIFATHYHELVNLVKELPRAFNLNVLVKEYKNEIIFMRKIIEGGADKSYGIHVAKLAGMPWDIVERSKEILKKLNQNQENNLEVDLEMKKNNQMDFFTNKFKNLLNDLNKININETTPLEALHKLDELKKRYKN